MLLVCAAIVAGVGLLTLWSWRIAPLNSDAIKREIVQRNLITGLAVIAAAALVLTLRSPWGEMDDAAGRTVRRVRLAIFLIATLLLTLAMITLGQAWESADAGWILARAFLGWLGVTVISRQVLGDSRGWWASFAWAGLSVIAGDSWRVHYPAWAWSMQGTDHRWASVFAVAAFLIGVSVLALTPIRSD